VKQIAGMLKRNPCVFLGFILPSMLLCFAATHPAADPDTAKEPATGLQKPFPKIVTRPDNPSTLEKIALGRLLFFDPFCRMTTARPAPLPPSGPWIFRWPREEHGLRR